MLKDTKVVGGFSSFVKKDYSEVYHNDQDGNSIENNISHSRSSLASHRPQIEDKRQYSSKDIKGQKIHSLSFFDNFIAMIKNDTVMAMPIENVSQGILPAALGTKAPTTNEANKIFAPSKKKSHIISIPSSNFIHPESTTNSPDCQGAEWKKITKIQ